jgi:hypothetical protein
MIPTSNQDGRQAKNRKKGDEILIVHCCFSISSNLGTFWLKIKQFWPFEEISIFSNGGHLVWRAGLSDKWPKLLYFKPECAQIGTV